MKKLSESVWMDIHKQSSGDIDRKEDEYTNIRYIEPVDMGVSVLWADRDLERKDGSYFFDYDDVSNAIQKSKWRIPTKKEVSELFKSAKHTNQSFETYTIDGKSQLVFNKKGYLLPPNESEKIKHPWSYLAWTSDESEYDGHLAFAIYKAKSYEPMYSKCRLCVRLVKDK